MKKEIKVGDIVVRSLGGIRQPLKVTCLTDSLIICGGDDKEHVGWWFDRESGVEEDEDLRWGRKFGVTGSYLEEE